MLVLPPTWPTEGDPAFETDEGYWPYRLLKTLARLPHEFQTRLWLGDTVPNGDLPQPYARNTKLCGALIAPMVMRQHESAEVYEYRAAARSICARSGRCTRTRCASSSTRALTA